jgi:hypothetical protein
MTLVPDVNPIGVLEQQEERKSSDAGASRFIFSMAKCVDFGAPDRLLHSQYRRIN